MAPFVDFLRTAFVGDERDLARTWQREVAEQIDAQAHEDAARFAADMHVAQGDDAIVLGRAEHRGEFYWAGMNPQQLMGMHSWIQGATGSGKSFFVLGILLQMLQDAEYPIVVVDLKGELAELVLGTMVPAVVADGRAGGLLDHLRVLRPFDEHYLPELRVTAPEPGVAREVQAHNLAAALSDALGDLGFRMDRIFLRLTTLAVELNRPLTDVLAWLEDRRAFLKAVRQSTDPLIRQYAAGSFEDEPQSSLSALAARLDAFFFLRETRLCLSAKRCLSFHDCLERGLTVVDLGNPPAGAERVARFWASVLVGALTRAILSRSVTDASPQAWVVLEEFQEALGRGQAAQFGRLLALARFKKVGLCFINQQPSQVAAVDPALVKLLRTNAGLEAIFRANLDDARAVAHALPVSSGTSADARTRLVAEITRLPDRTFYFWRKQAPYGAQLLRSPRLDLAELRALAAELDRDLRQRIRRGTVAVPRAELEALVAGAVPPVKATTGVEDVGTEHEVQESGSDEFPSLG